MIKFCSVVLKKRDYLDLSEGLFIFYTNNGFASYNLTLVF